MLVSGRKIHIPIQKRLAAICNLIHCVGGGGLVLALMASLVSCSNEVAGVVTETQNGEVAGVVEDTSGTGIEGVAVILYPGDYNPIGESDSNLIYLTNSKGEYLIKNVSPGTYNLVAQIKSDKIGSLVWDVVMEEDKNKINVPEIILRKVGQIEISLIDIKVRNEGYFYIPGTGIYNTVDSSALKKGTLILNDVPPSIFTQLNYVDQYDSSGINILARTISIESGAKLVLDNKFYWNTTKKITIKTSTLSLSQDIPFYPLIIRLRSGQIDFSAAPNGKNIRITKSGGIHLPFEVETWNAQDSVADIWVKLDTLFANNDTQFVNLHIGIADTNLLPQITSVSVFDTLTGFRGVWHFSETYQDTLPQISDASNAQNNGVLHGNNPAKTAPSILNQGIDFNGLDQYIFSQNQYLAPLEFTLSFWMKTSTQGGGRIMMFREVNAESKPLLTQKIDRWVWMGDSGRLHFGVFDISDSTGIKSISSGATYNDDVWHFITTTYTQGILKLYVDGAKVSEGDFSPGFDEFVYLGYWAMAHFGKEVSVLQPQWEPIPNNKFFQGVLDEVRAVHVVRSEDWIKLNYETQKLNTNLIVIVD